jgi:DNA-binding LacI/PurR family transcriptional regulator
MEIASPASVPPQTAFIPTVLTPVESGGGKRVAIYVGGDPKRDPSMFYLNLLWLLMSQGQARGWEMVPMVELRSPSMAVLPPPELARLAAQRPVDGVVGFMVYESATRWMEESGVPWAAMLGSKRDNYVDLDYDGMLRSGLTRLAELGCKSAGLIIPAMHTGAKRLEWIDAEAERLGIVVNYEWIIVTRESQEQSGYDDMCALWALKHRPEGLLVFPDRTARGVVSAILEKQIRVPDDLKLVLHRNAESPYMVPMVCDWVEVSVGEIARALLDSLEDAWTGRPQKCRSVPLTLIKGS